MVFDFIELTLPHMGPAAAQECRARINRIFDMHACAWRLADGEFFMVDADFMGARLAETAHDALAANNFAGAADEYATARRNLTSGEVKDAIFYAGKSFESVMKQLTGRQHDNADQLIKAILALGYFDDLPEEMRGGFTAQVMKALPFLRNKLGGHGQGEAVVDVPPVYGELALQLAAAFHNFLLSKHLERAPPEPPPSEQARKRTPLPTALDDDIPF
jgi:hypothetical protein